MKFHSEQAGLWLKPNTVSQLKTDMPQADISTIYKVICENISLVLRGRKLKGKAKYPIYTFYK